MTSSSFAASFIVNSLLGSLRRVTLVSPAHLDEGVVEDLDGVDLRDVPDVPPVELTRHDALSDGRGDSDRHSSFELELEPDVDEPVALDVEATCRFLLLDRLRLRHRSPHQGRGFERSVRIAQGMLHERTIASAPLEVGRLPPDVSAEGAGPRVTAREVHVVGLDARVRTRAAVARGRRGGVGRNQHLDELIIEVHDGDDLRGFVILHYAPLLPWR